MRLLVANDAARGARGRRDARGRRGAGRSGSPRRRAGADAAVVSGHAANCWFHQVPDVPVAADLYDPFSVENLHYARDARRGDGAPRPRDARPRARARATSSSAPRPSSGSSTPARSSTRGRIGARELSRRTRRSRACSRSCPSACPPSRPRGDRAAGPRARSASPRGRAARPLRRHLRLVRPGAAARGLARDPARGSPDARLLFFENPNPRDDAAARLRRARGRARARSIREGRSIVFSPWLPYAARADLYAAADLLVSISSDGPRDRARLPDAPARRRPGAACRRSSVGGGSLARELAAAGRRRSSARATRRRSRGRVIGAARGPRRGAHARRRGGAGLRRGARLERRRRAARRLVPRRPRRSGAAARAAPETRIGRAAARISSVDRLPAVTSPGRLHRRRAPPRARAPARGARGARARAGRGLSAEIVLVDNASGTPAGRGPPAGIPTCAASPRARNVGFAAGCRLGVEAARAPVVALRQRRRRRRARRAAPARRGARRRRRRTSWRSGGRLTDWTGAKNDFSDGFLTFDGHAFAADVGRPVAALPPARPGRGAALRLRRADGRAARRVPRLRADSTTTTSPTSRTWTSAGGSGSSAGASSPSRGPSRATAAARRARRSASSRAASSSRRTPSRPSTRTSTRSTSAT